MSGETNDDCRPTMSGKTDDDCSSEGAPLVESSMSTDKNNKNNNKNNNRYNNRNKRNSNNRYFNSRPMMSGKIDDDCSSVDSTSTFLIGDMQDFNKGKREVRPKNDNLTYHPTHHWWEPPLSAWFPEANREILYLLWIYNALVVVLARFTNLCGSPADVDDAEFCSEDFMLHEDMELRGFSLGLFLLLSFRANQGYDRFWEGRKMWGRMREVSRDFARLVCAHVKVKSSNDMLDRSRAINFVTAFAISCKLHLRNEHDIRRDCQDLGLKLCHQDVANIQHADHMPLFCQDILSNYLNTQVDEGKLSDHQLGVINKTCMSVMSDALGSCERIANTPLPLSYVLQLQFFMILWLLLFPLHGANYYGWWSILLANLVAFAVWGMESMICEIEDPFGHGRNDLDLDAMVAGSFKETQAVLQRAESQHKDFIFNRRRVEEISERHLAHQFWTTVPLSDPE